MLGIQTNLVQRRREQRNIPPYLGHALSVEGATLRSVEEGLVDAYLHHHGIAHEHEVLIGRGRYSADFRIHTGEFWEVAGMLSFDKYRQRHEKKRKIYSQLGLEPRWITADEAVLLYRSCDPVPTIGFAPPASVRLVKPHGSYRLEGLVEMEDLIHTVISHGWARAARTLSVSDPTVRRWVTMAATDDQIARIRAAGRSI